MKTLLYSDDGVVNVTVIVATNLSFIHSMSEIPNLSKHHAGKRGSEQRRRGSCPHGADSAVGEMGTRQKITESSVKLQL